MGIIGFAWMAATRLGGSHGASRSWRQGEFVGCRALSRFAAKSWGFCIAKSDYIAV